MRFHGKQRHNLKQMILDHVAQTPGRLVKCAPRSHPETFRQCDLHTGDVIAVPDWFEKCVCEPEVKDIHDRFLAQKVIDLRKIESSGKTERATRLSASAPAPGHLNGFSTATRAFLWPAPPRRAQAVTVTKSDGGMAR